MQRKAFRPKKRLGQNFLYDPAIAGKIVSAASPSAQQVVVELGAGKGILTKPLSETGARIIAIELDRELYAELHESFRASAVSGRVEILNEDFTDVSLAKLLADRGLERCFLMGNIPYHLTREVLFPFLVEEHGVIEASYLMMQREVGDRIIAGHGSRTYGITSVILQSLYSVRRLFNVAPGSFHPRPKVMSTVLEFTPLAERLVPAGELEAFVSLVKNLFQQRRKTIQNTIKAFYSTTPEQLSRIEDASGVSLARRPEEISKEEFLRLSRAVAASAASE